MKRYLNDNKHKVVKICIILYFFTPVLREISLRGTFPPITLPIIWFSIPISNFFSFSWLASFFATPPPSLTTMISLLDSRIWLGLYFYLITYHGSVPIGSFYDGRLYPIASLDPTILLLFEAAIFLIGVILFSLSILHSTRNQANERSIVPTGIYKYIRHPQNLALIMITLPFALYIPGVYDRGICFGDVLCWFQFIILLTLYSDYADYKSKTSSPEDFLNYYQHTGFFLPKFLSIKRLQFLSIFNRPIVRYLCLLLIYLLIVLLCFQVYHSGDWLR